MPSSSETNGDDLEIHRVRQGKWVWLISPCTDTVRREGWDICPAGTKAHTHPYTLTPALLKFYVLCGELFSPSIHAGKKVLLYYYSKLQGNF